MVTHQTFQNEKGEWIEPGEVHQINGGYFDNKNKKIRVGKVEKMSKSKKNVVDPNDIIINYGADTARWFMLSDSPPERDLQWTETGIASSYKFINKLWEFVHKYEVYKSNTDDDDQIINTLKELINNVAINIENFQFNKSVANIYQYVNVLSEATTNNTIGKETFKWSLTKLSLILQPFLPHISEEIYEKLGKKDLCINESWPDEKIVEKNKKAKVAIQINGKTRSVMEFMHNSTKEDMIKIIKDDKKILKYLKDKKIIKEIYVPNKIINFVIND